MPTEGWTLIQDAHTATRQSAIAWPCRDALAEFTATAAESGRCRYRHLPGFVTDDSRPTCQRRIPARRILPTTVAEVLRPSYVILRAWYFRGAVVGVAQAVDADQRPLRPSTGHACLHASRPLPFAVALTADIGMADRSASRSSEPQHPYRDINTMSAKYPGAARELAAERRRYRAQCSRPSPSPVLGIFRWVAEIFAPVPVLPSPPSASARFASHRRGDTIASPAGIRPCVEHRQSAASKSACHPASQCRTCSC